MVRPRVASVCPAVWWVLVLSALAVSACGGAPDVEDARRSGEGHTLPTEPFELPAEGSVVTFSVRVAAGQFLRWQVWQDGVDVVLRLVAPDGRVIHEADSPYGKHGPEDLVAITQIAGIHRVEVETLAVESDSDRGVVRPERLVVRPAKEKDKTWVEADRSFRRGRKMTAKQDLEAGVDALYRALVGFERLGLVRQMAETHDALALQHGRRRQLDLGIAHAERAARLFADVGLQRRQGLALQRVGVWQLVRNRVAASVEALDRSVALLEDVRHWDAAANVHSQLGNAYRRLGDLEAALAHCERAIELQAEEPDRVAARAHHNRGTALLSLNRPEQAAAAYEAAARIYRERDLPAAYALAAEEGRANALALAGGLEEALALAREVERLSGEIPPDPTRVKILTTLGRIHRLRGETKQAAALLRQAASLAETLGDARNLATAELESGYVEMLAGDPEASLVHHDRALGLFRGLEDVQGTASARLRKAETLARLGRPGEALAHVREALATVESIRRSSGTRTRRLSYFALRQEYFDLAIDLLVDLSRGGEREKLLLEALDVHEQSRARELLRARVREPSAGLSEGRRARVEELENQLASQVTSPSLDNEAEGRHEIERLLEAVEQEWSRDLGEAGVEPVRSAEFRRRFLDSETLALIYARVGERLVLWALSSDAEVRFVSLDLPRPVESYADALTTGTRGGEHERRERRRMGRELARVLFGPVQDLLPGRRLVLVPDAHLEGIPFAMLPAPTAPASGSAAQDGTRHLVEDHEIVMLPSLSSVALQAPDPTTSHRSPALAALGDPVFGSEDPRVTATSPPNGARDGAVRLLGPHHRAEDFDRLPHSRAEVLSLVPMIDRRRSLLALDFAANRDTFFDLDPERYQVLHVATHAAIHPDLPELSGLVLSLVDAAGRPRPGIVRAYEIRRSHLPFELVNLSACSTGRGRQTPGEGLLSLARAFLDAGARRVVSSLWDVEDRTTAVFMTYFYDAYLDQGLSGSAALRQAQLRMIADPATASPHQWAPFIFQGDWSSLRQAQEYSHE